MVQRWDQRPNIGRYVSLPASWVGSRKTRTNIPYVGQWLNNGYPFNVAPPVWIDETLDNFVYGVSGTQELSVSFTRGVTFSISLGALPAGITMSSSGGVVTIAGTPTSKLHYSFRVRATGVSNGGYIEKSFSGTPTVNKIVATGGTTFDYNGYRVHAFTATSNFVVGSGCDDVEVMLLSGGGGGRGDGNGGGGGAGGGKIVQTALRISGTNAVVIGGGGAAGANGTASSALGVSVAGGGAGGALGTQGNSGGSGGGGGGFASGGLATINVTTGYHGGAGGFYNGGGGGGTGGLGNNGNANPNETGGDGGPAQVFPYVSGWANPATLVGRGGGGGGGGGNNGGEALGGSGGGTGKGNASGVGGVGTNGDTNYGGGGGYFTGGNGSTGMVWVRYRL